MPYLPLDLDAKRKLEGIEKALALPEFTMVGRAMHLWETVWREKSDVVDELTMLACFGADPRVRQALVARDFVEPVEEKFRVRGAAKWLFGLEGKSRGGKAAAKHLIPGPKPKRSAEEPHIPEPSSSASAEGQPKDPLGTSSALTSSIQHPASNSLLETQAPAGASERRKSPPARKETPDPRLRALTTLLVWDYLDRREGDRYRHGGAKDTEAIKRLIALGLTDQEIRSRWRYGLRAQGWLCVNSIAQLDSKWNDLSGYGAPVPEVNVDTEQGAQA